MFEPTYAAAQAHLTAFVPHAGFTYASQRNYDRQGHPNVSLLSPYLRHRIITEEEVLSETLRYHSPKAAEKFIQEVVWRTYWKGWLQMRPAVWDWYKSDLQAALNRVQTESGLRADWEAACKGETGIDCFDHWAKELTKTGYLHNHARMWFASIWIFTLRLPWTLGADFFMRHLLDGDPASNTLSWRWVGGLQTQGKTYLARHDNIQTYTEGRFDPKGLATHAVPLEGPAPPPAAPITLSDSIDASARTGLLLTEDDLSPGWLLDKITPVATVTIDTTQGRSPLKVAPHILDFTTAAVQNVTLRHAITPIDTIASNQLVDWAQKHNISQIVTSQVPVGPTADMLNTIAARLEASNITVVRKLRAYDADAWPCATKGFFKFRETIPAMLARLDNRPKLL